MPMPEGAPKTIWPNIMEKTCLQEFQNPLKIEVYQTTAPHKPGRVGKRAKIGHAAKPSPLF